MTGTNPVVRQLNKRHASEHSGVGEYSRPDALLVHEMVEKQANRRPHDVAIRWKHQEVTYRELMERVHEMADYLSAHGVSAGQRVAIYLDRGVEAVVAMFGVLRSSASYVPLDTSYPAERVHYILRDAAPSIVLTQRMFEERLTQSEVPKVFIESPREGEVPRMERRPFFQDSLTRQPQPADTAYIIYTSGSTGGPKGVMVSHANLRSSNLARLQYYGNPGRFLLLSPLGFDSSVAGLFGTLTGGGTLVLASEEEIRSPLLLVRAIKALRVNTLLCVPSLYRRVLAVSSESIRDSELSRVIVAGEVCPPALIAESNERAPQVKVFNEYGPTEATVWATVYECKEAEAEPIPIGRPIRGTCIHILDPMGQPVAVGAAGELWIGGDGVAQGYLNLPELTAQRFVSDRFSETPNARMYRTGDLGRWRVDGNIEYLGRNDNQVKLRGFRIELGEVETALLRHRCVQEAVAIVREDTPGDRLLVAYVVIAPTYDAAHISRDLQSYLLGTLPAYMVPASIVVLSDLPRTPNGKIERQALPPPHLSVIRESYEAPQGVVEQTLAEIWEQLLGIPRIGRRDHFIQLGGHSLRMMQMIERLHERGWSGTIENAFAYPTLFDFARTLEPLTDEPDGGTGSGLSGGVVPDGCTALISSMVPLARLNQAELEALVAQVPGGAADIQDVLPLTPLQEGMLFHHLQREDAGDTYVLPTLLQFQSRATVDSFRSALQELIARHESLRVSIRWLGLPHPVQIVHRTAALETSENILNDSASAIAQLMRRVGPDASRLDLTQAPLMRLEVYSCPTDTKLYAILRLHHMIADHESIELLFHEANACILGRRELLPPIARYREYIGKVFAGPQEAAVNCFFANKLGDVDEPTVSFNLLQVHGDGRHNDEAQQLLGKDITAGVVAMARRLAVTPSAIFHAAWALVVAATSARDRDVVFGSLFGGRLRASGREQHTFGLFINTLPVRIRIGECNARDFVHKVQTELTELLPYQQASLAITQRCTAIQGQQPLFNTLLNCLYSGKHSSSPGSNPLPGVKVLETREWTNYPITLSVDAVEDKYNLIAQTDRRIPPERILGYMQSALSALVSALSQGTDRAVLTLAVVPAAERSTLVEEFNRTATEYPKDQLVHELFEQQVVRAPSATAIVWAQNRMTYGELNDRANLFARQMQAQGVELGEFIPVLMGRSVELLVAQLAILKVGAAYVPIDPEAPADRQEFMIRDCGARHLVLGTGHSPPAGVGHPMQTIHYELDFVPPHGTPIQPSSGLAPRCTRAYLMYTSGSTGEPKGVVVSHQGIAKLCVNNGYADIRPDDCVVHGANPAFDASTFEVWAALLNGARVFVVPQSVLFDASRFASDLKRHQATVLWMTVGLLMQYADALDEVFGQLRYLITGGDVVDPEVVRRVFRAKGPNCFLNAYGPTECTTFTTAYRITPEDTQASSLPIGRPISNTRLYVLNGQLQPVPLGATGEIYIGGMGVALGYLNRPQVTAARFFRDPFSADPEDRLYRTGDLGKWRADGNLEFVGRNDQQVKIRGYRVEPGEIETCLLQHPAIKEAVVVARPADDGGKRLIAYVTTRTEDPLEPATCRAFLKDRLPLFMVPSAIVRLDRLPLNSSGKIDRQGLPAPAHDAYARHEYQAPVGDVETLLARTWQELLRVPRVGREDNFFELGGHSLLAMQVVVHIRAALSIELPMSALFEFPSLELLAAQVECLRSAQVSADLQNDPAQMDELLALVKSMPQGAVRQWVEDITNGGVL